MALRFFSESRWLSECSILANLSRKPPVAAYVPGFLETIVRCEAIRMRIREAMVAWF
jgi:hypothetical protein